MGRQADEKLPETEARRDMAPPSQHGFTEGPAHARALFPRIHRWAINSRERVGLYLHER
jgi:hypothetical protein